MLFGVSPDSVKSHVKFREKYALPYRLLSDAGHQVAEEFGVWVEKSFAGPRIHGNERTSFIIGPDGTVEHVLAKREAGRARRPDPRRGRRMIDRAPRSAVLALVVAVIGLAIVGAVLGLVALISP